MGSHIFEKTIGKFIREEKSETSEFIRRKFLESRRQTYYGFLDDFLIRLGLISFNLIPSEKANKYVPYLSFAEDNIFGEGKGFKDLTAKPVSKSEGEKIIAEYLVDQFRRLPINQMNLS